MPAKASGARRSTAPTPRLHGGAAAAFYVLDHQIGFALRLAHQRHCALFAERIGDPELTPTQWAALAKLWQTGPTSQNRLGRLTGMDASTIRGVVNRLIKRGLVDTRPDKEDARLLLVGLTREGTQLYRALAANALEITEETLSPLNKDERETLMRLLDKMR
jgi:MarR family transcriptional regulator, lower aerobic nicotinate degradation pathway regulator